METPPSKFELAWKVREGGQNWTEVTYLDFVVDGHSLKDLLGGDLASCLGWMPIEANEEALRRLLLDEPADLPNDRRSLYICPECGELGCGAVTLNIQAVDDTIVWSDFGYEHDYSDVDFEGYENVGPFVFRRSDYRETLKNSRFLTSDVRSDKD